MELAVSVFEGLYAYGGDDEFKAAQKDTYKHLVEDCTLVYVGGIPGWESVVECGDCNMCFGERPPQRGRAPRVSWAGHRLPGTTQRSSNQEAPMCA